MRSVGRNVYFELSRSSAPDAKTAGARVRTASSDRLRSKALAWEENDRLEMAFMMESSRGSWAGLPAAGRSRGAEQSRIEDRPAAARASALVLDGEHPAIHWEESAIPPSPSFRVSPSW